jgi:hypothetical protein
LKKEKRKRGKKNAPSTYDCFFQTNVFILLTLNLEILCSSSVDLTNISFFWKKAQMMDITKIGGKKRKKNPGCYIRRLYI